MFYSRGEDGSALVAVTQPQPAVLALYLRERWGVREATGQLPPADPPVEMRPGMPTKELDQLWNTWCTDLLTGLDYPTSTSVDGLPPVPPGTAMAAPGRGCRPLVPVPARLSSV